jgi:hypothetical protein
MTMKTMKLLTVLSILISIPALAEDPRSVKGGGLRLRPGAPTAPGLCEEQIDERFSDVNPVLVNIGEKAWELIVDNKGPIGLEVSQSSSRGAHALPKGVLKPDQIGPWCGTGSRSFELEFSNILGMSLFRTKIGVHFMYGAPFRGKGKHLANVTVVPSEFNSKIGFTANVRVKVSDPIYVQKQVALMRVIVEVNVRGPIDNVTESKVFEIKGDGTVATN